MPSPTAENAASSHRLAVEHRLRAGVCGFTLPGMKSTIKRWVESIAQNILASALFLGGTALVVYLLAHGGNRLTAHVWWVAVAVGLILVLVGWLMWLTRQVSVLRTSPSAGASFAATAVPPHPYQDLLDRMDATIEQFERYESHESVSWQTGQTYNDMMKEARAINPRINLQQLPVATEVTMHSASSITDPSARELAGGLRHARIQVARTTT